MGGVLADGRVGIEARRQLWCVGIVVECAVAIEVFLFGFFAELEAFELVLGSERLLRGQWRFAGSSFGDVRSFGCGSDYRFESACGLSENQASADWFRDGVAEFPGCLQPQVDGVLSVAQGFFLGVTVSGAAGELRHLGDVGFVFLAPVDDHFVLGHSPPNFASTITVRTCFT